MNCSKLAIAGLAATMLAENSHVKARDVRNRALVIRTRCRQFNQALPPELNLIGDGDELFEIFDSDEPCEDALVILRQHQDFLEWVVGSMYGVVRAQAFGAERVRQGAFGFRAD